MYDLNPIEVRILGCLLEKQRTTPDTYPITLNALRLACNQLTNRDPIVEYDDVTIQDELQKLHRRNFTRAAGGHGSRSSKYRHLLSETLELADDELAVLCVLLLRGDQTPGELKQRTERLHHFDDLDSLEQTLTRLAERGLAWRLDRRPGEKQVRYRHLMSGDDYLEESGISPVGPINGSSALGTPTTAETTPGTTSVALPLPSAADGAEPTQLKQLWGVIEALGAEVAELRSRVEELESPEPEEESPGSTDD